MSLRLFFTAFCLSLFSYSCADMIQSLREESIAVNEEADRDREDGENNIYGYQPKTLKGLSANNVDNYEPEVVRGYGRRLASEARPSSNYGYDSSANEYKRLTRADFVDSDPSENSLWDSQGQGNYLFSNNRRKEIGDLVTANVERELKREIQYQLWMLLPPDQRRVRKPKPSAEKDATADATKPPPAGENKSAEEKNKDEAEEAAKRNLASTGAEDDIIRMEVSENIGNGLVRMVGQKKVIYRGVSRVVEVMALVNAKDIDDQSMVKSSAFLDMKTQVIQ
ncbi:MAG: flagellar basal body L-ring protein FlgH [Oligoflexia bacterium]|nr:flagellar basal body L-ring protein FlgH [Oligoflexia bacterium]